MTEKTTYYSRVLRSTASPPLLPQNTYLVSVLGHPGELYPILKATPILTQSANLQPMTASNQQAAATPIDDYSSSAIFIGRKNKTNTYIKKTNLNNQTISTKGKRKN